MAEVVTELKSAIESQELLESQQFRDWKAHLLYYQEITKTAETLLNYKFEVELLKLLSKGVLLNGGKTWFSLNKKGEHCEMLSSAECLDSEFKINPLPYRYNSRFAMGTYPSEDGILKTRVQTQFLSPGITYAVNLVFKFILPDEPRKCQLISLKYKLKGDTKASIAHLAYEREDGWWMCELYQFTSDHNIIDLEILFDGFDRSYAIIEVEGIEFRPLEKVGCKDPEDEKLDMQSTSDSGTSWKEKLPIDYEDIMKWQKNSANWTTKNKAYSIICKGFLIDDGEKATLIGMNIYFHY